MSKKLLEPIKLGKLNLKNRIVMPPMTRSRAKEPGDIPNPIMVKYYSDRADAGLIVSEGAPISEQGRGYSYTPGIYSHDQMNGWRAITNAVHQKGGVMFCQLWHVGRMAHTDTTGGRQPVSPSDVKVQAKVFVNGEFKQVSDPRGLSQDEINEITSQFKQAASNSIDCGFDGIELHGANGYLINQFLNSKVNNRVDEYGVSLQGRLRFLKEVTESMGSQIGYDRIGVRLSPVSAVYGCEDENYAETYTGAFKLLNQLKVAYIHISEPTEKDAPVMSDDYRKTLRQAYSGTIICTGNYTVAKAEEVLSKGYADMVGFGRHFISNPDLVSRVKNDIPFSPFDAKTFFGGDEKGLNDYPTHTT